MKPIEVEYIESGTFVGGEEDCSGLKTHDKFVVLKQTDYEKLTELRSKSIGDGFYILQQNGKDVFLKNKESYLTFIRKCLETAGYSVSVEPIFETNDLGENKKNWISIT